MEDKTLDTLRDMTDKLPAIPKLRDVKEIIKVSRDGNYHEFQVVNGTSFVNGLFECTGVSVVESFLSAGGEFPIHIHDEKEIIVIYSGMMIVYEGESRYTYKTGDVIVFDPGVPHRVKALDDTRFIVITVPNSKDYPQ